MAICPKCGAEMTPDRTFCTVCGSALTPPQPSYESYSQQPNPDYAPPYAAYPPQNVYPPTDENRVLSTGGFLLSLILLSLPIIGFAIAIIWACGGTASLNRRNLARAKLILLAIGVVIAILLGILIATFANSAVGAYWESFLPAI